jgi:hypothetical protein
MLTTQVAMRSLWESFLAVISRAWRTLTTSRDGLLKLVIVAAILLAAGPELVAALELQILLEVLGATLFLTAFAAGARLALLNLALRFRDVVLPAAPVAFILIAYAEWWLAYAATCIASIQAFHTFLE